MAEKRNSWKEILSEKLAGSIARYILSDIDMKIAGDIEFEKNKEYDEDSQRLIHEDGKGEINLTVSFERKLKD